MEPDYLPDYWEAENTTGWRGDTIIRGPFTEPDPNDC